MNARIAPCVIICALVSACATNTEPTTLAPEAEAEAPAVAPPEQGHAAGGVCEARELEVCASACYDVGCFEWCAGPGCRAALVSLDACVAEVDARFGDAPDYEFVESPDGEPYPTDESLDRVERWYEAYDAALDERWAAVCEDECAASIDEADDGADFCAEDWRDHRDKWAELSAPPAPSPRSEAGGLVAVMGGGLLDSGTAVASVLGVGGSSLELVDAPSVPVGDERRGPLQAIVVGQGAALGGLSDCVPDPPEDGVSFEFEVELGPTGEVVAFDLLSGAAVTGNCVGAQLSAGVVLPSRVARDVGRMRVRALVRERPDYDGMDWGRMEGTDFDGLGQGLSGSGIGGGGGAGGGGEGAALGGLGSVRASGSAEDQRAEPEDSD